MADPNVATTPSSDPSFMSASPEERHAYLMDTNPEYASASPEDQKGYLQYLVTEGAKQNIAKYPRPSQQENHWVGKMVPQAATPVMQKITESAPIQAAEAIGQKGAQFGHDIAEQAVTAGDVLTHPVESFNAAAPSFGPKPIMRPLEQTAHEEHPIAMGAATGLGEVVGGLADPRQALLVALSSGAESAAPLLSKIASGAFGAQMGAGAVEAAADLQKNWNRYTPEQRANVAAHIAADAYFAKGALEHTGVPGKIGETAKTVAAPMVRAMGHGIEGASTPTVAGGAIGGAIGGRVAGSTGAEIGTIGGSALGAGIAHSLGKNPIEPMVRVPRMTKFGLPEAPTELPPLKAQVPYGPEGPPPFMNVEDTSKDVFNATPVQQPVDKGLETLKTAYDKANAAYQKAYEAREAYRASMDQGVEPPVAIQKAFEKAQKALDEAQYHYEAATEARKNAPVQQEAQPEQELTNPPAVRGGQHELPGGGVMGKPLQLKGEVAPEPQAPQNVKKPGEVAPETETPTAVRMRRAEQAAQEPQGMPVMRGGRQELAEGHGVMGKPLQLTAGTPEEAPAQAQPAARMQRPDQTNDQVKKIATLTREGLGGKELIPNKPLREQVQPKTEVLPPEKPAVQAEEPKTVEAEMEHPRNLVHANGEALSNAIPKTAAGHELLQKLHNLSNIDLRQLAINAGEDMGQLKIGRGKQSGNISRPEVFERLLKNHSAEDLGRMVDEGKHQPTVGEIAPPAPKAEAKAEEPKVEAPKEEAKELPPTINQEAQEIHEKYNEQKKYAEETFSDPQEKADYLKAIKISRDNKLARMGVSGGATAAPEQYGANTPEAVAKENDWFAQARKEKPDATLSEQLQYAQELKNQSHTPKQEEHFVTKSVDKYGKENGFPEINKEKPSKVSPDARRIADAYDEAKHEPDTPAVKKSYEAFKNDIKKQWDYITKDMGIKVEPQAEDPYTGFEDMKKDVLENKRLKVFTGGTEMPADHPQAQIDPKTGLSYNVMFRAVHDIFGHLAGDNDFSELGEEGAWDRHRQTLDKESVPAMTTETRSQTSSYFKNNGFPEQKATVPPEYALSSPADAVKVLDHIKSGKDYALLTAENPHNTRISDEENAKRNEDFVKDLREAGYNPVPVEGHVKDVEGHKENSFFIPDIPAAEIKRLGEKYGQSSVLTSKGLYDLEHNTIIPLDKKGPLLGDEARNAGYYSTIGGEPFSVTLDLDGEKPIEAPKASMETARMSDQELAQHGFTPEDIEAGKHLPTVSGGKISKTEAEELAEKHLKEGEGFGSERGRENFINRLTKLPSVQEFTDIAKAGESGRKWYQRSAKAFDALIDAAPRYFQEGDRQKFTNFLAALSPQQSVKMNLQEALHAWSKYVDMGRPEGKPLEKMLRQELTLADAKVPNAMRALAGQEMWPDLSNNRNFKVPSFSKNLNGFMDKVTNDGWQAAFAGLKPTDIQTASGYHPLAVVTRAAAEALGWEPAEAQAAIWAFVKTLTEKGIKSPENIRQYSEDFADLLAHDNDIRRQLTDLGIDTGALDERLRQIERKPEVTPGASPTAENSIRKLAKRIEKQRGKLPQPKDSGLFEKVDADERENFFKSPKDEGDTSFNPNELDEGVKTPITDKLVEKYGTTDEPLGAAQFIASDGRRIPVQDHDHAVKNALGKSKVDPEDRIKYLNDEQAVRVRFRGGQRGKEVVFSVPKEVSPEQVKQMEKTVGALGQYGNMHVEQAHEGGNYASRINAKPDMVESAIKEVNRKGGFSSELRAFHQAAGDD